MSLSGYHFYGSMKTNGQLVENVVMTTSNIQASKLDMNNQKITSVATPTDPYDAANKYYVDQRLANAYQSFTVTLQGRSSVEVTNLLPGSYMVIINPLVDGGPTAMVAIAKSRDVIATGGNVIAQGQSITQEQLVLEWQASSPVTLRKTGDNYDGDYSVSFVK